MLTRAAVRVFSTQGLKVYNDIAKQQFVITMKNGEAILKYKQIEKNITFIHTKVPQVFQGKGVGKILAEYAFDLASKDKLNVICKCHFLAKYYKDNQNKYKDLNIKFQLDD